MSTQPAELKTSAQLLKELLAKDKSYAHTNIPDSAYTEDTIGTAAPFLCVPPLKIKNKHGGFSTKWYLDDGVSKGRVPVFAAVDLYTKWGPDMAKTKEEVKLELSQPPEKVHVIRKDKSYQVRFPNNQNPQLEKFSDVCDTAGIANYAKHSEAFLGPGKKKMTVEQVEGIWRPTRRVPESTDTLATYGTNCICRLDPNEQDEPERTQYYIRDENNVVRKCKYLDVHKKPGHVTAIISLEKLNLGSSPSCGLYIKLYILSTKVMKNKLIEAIVGDVATDVKAEANNVEQSKDSVAAEPAKSPEQSTPVNGDVLAVLNNDSDDPAERAISGKSKFA